MASQYVIGIDLGTTNSVLAYAALADEKPQVQLLSIPQLTAAATVENRDSLASFVYQAGKHEKGAFDLSWAKGRQYAVGEYARRQSAEFPDRTIGAAKSWLCHSKVDRHQPILPWNAPEDTPKISPITASRYYLQHLIAAWEEQFPDAPVKDQQVVLTVPASFDVSARELTREAAREAGLPDTLILLEEPQAAVYSWLAVMGDKWRKMLRVNEKLLVCDVGGGTTDLTLVGVAEENGELTLERIAVGNHLLVGGDNMDLALAHYAAGLFEKQKVKLNPWQSVSLWHSCRAAKEILLAEDGPESTTVSVLGRGSKLIGGTVSVELEAAAVKKLLVDGFLPECSLTDRPSRQRASGFLEIGLPFESDTAITRHLSAFLQSHGADEAVEPTHVLFNGGVFRSDALRSQLLSVIRGWFTDDAAQLLAGDHDLDHAVARGAAYYGHVKQQGGMRIRGGAARSYYIGIETAGLAIPGAPRPLRALCVVPQGMEEGAETDVPSGEVGLVLGEPAQFRFFSSNVRRQDRPGDLLSSWDEEELVETDSLETILPPDEHADDAYVPVRFRSHITELGVFELWCVSANSDARWKLEFSVREE
ncbi:Hsp70 family protein [Lignipirellula cremea]|uniref:Chaperone protein DnaK n=1 Tax=Lignipirellula cremea TaxID=2528010 RepID=A0A518DYL5_9BACT|nr:Hsp70 family protein [Lignipirellula cremea]QDU96938.1 Chaperone protein DnaK [Lignipirellula cremea]